MRVEDAVERIERSSDKSELAGILQAFIEARGFHSFTFVENEANGRSDPLIVNTIPPSWEDDYRRNDFLFVDPCLPMAQRGNTSFTWADVPLPPRRGVRKPAALRLMDAVQDHGFAEGMVLPFHFRDNRGIYHSTVCTLFWKSSIKSFRRRLTLSRTELHLVLIYWTERVVRLQSGDIGRSNEAAGILTDRERDVLAWAANGKTIDETAVILGISADTASGYMKSAMRKLDAVSKTQAVVRAISEGLIRL